MMDTDLRIDTEKKVPSLRFSGFDEEWEEKRLGSVAEIIMGQSPAGDSYNTTGIGTVLINGPVEFTEKYPIKTKWTSRPTKFCQNKDILFCVRGSTTGKMNIADGVYCIGRGVAAIRANKKSTPEFIEFLIVKNLTQILTLTSGSTFFNLDSKSLREYSISFPTLPEQQKIASFLTAVDEKLQALKQQKNLLEQYKKGMMQKIFSQEIRFKDDEGKEFGEWEMKKLGEVAEITGGGTPETNIKDYWDGPIQWFTPTEIKNDFVLKSSRTITELGLKKSSAKILPKGAILLTTRATIGEVSIALEECTTNQGFQSLVAKKNNHNIFLFNWIKNNKFELIKRANGSTFPEISKSEIEQIPILLPTLPEQTKIANFLSAIDEKISHCQVQITKMEQYKKGLLQQLFV